MVPPMAETVDDIFLTNNCICILMNKDASIGLRCIRVLLLFFFANWGWTDSISSPILMSYILHWPL